MSNATIKSEQLTKADFKVILDVLNVFDTETAPIAEMKTDEFESEVLVAFKKVLDICNDKESELTEADFKVILDVLNVFYPEDCTHPNMKDDEFFGQVEVAFKKVLDICI
jgi:hypothetical protein